MRIAHCRICKSKKIEIILKYSNVALSGSFLKKKEINKEKKFPLNLVICKNCKHTQIDYLVNPDLLFKNYLWETGISSTNNTLILSLIKKIVKLKKIDKETKIFEIASNDGSCLKIFKDKFQSTILGIDPAKNLALKANINKINTIADYFNIKKSINIKKKYGKFDIIIARNVLAHVINPLEIFKGVEKIISKNGIFVVEVPHLLNIYQKLQYDNVFHEHVGFHSLKSFIDMCKIAKLNVFDVDLINSQGGSIRVLISKNNDFKKTTKVKKILDKEKNAGLFNMKSWHNYSLKVKKNKKDLNRILEKIKLNKKKISIYGASGKGQVLLQFIENSQHYFDKIYDKSKLKLNLYSPGTHFKILDPKSINIDKPDYLFVCTWNLLNEIIKEQRYFVKQGGKFIVPFPKPKII